MAVEVGETTGKEEEAAKSERVGRDEPLEVGIFYVELVADGGQRDHYALNLGCEDISGKSRVVAKDSSHS